MFTSKPYDLDYYSDTNILGLNATNSTVDASFKGSFLIAVNEVLVGNNSIVDNESLWHINSSSNSGECKLYNNLDSSFNNFFLIEVIDTIDYYIIGEFEFSAINECQDTIRITDGFFDLNYRF